MDRARRRQGQGHATSGPLVSLVDRARGAAAPAPRQPAPAHGARHPKKSGGLLRQGEHLRFAFIEAEKAHWPVTVMCDVLEVSRSGYYAWAQHKVSARALDDARLAVMIRASHRRSRGTYGSPRIHADLRAQGIHVGKKRVERLMQADSLEARRKRRFRTTTDSNHDHPIAPERLGRDFHRDAPNETWVTDVTYVWTLEGWLYLAVMLDLFSRRVVGWAVSDRNDRSLAQEALQRALERRRPPRGLVHHSDRGSVYASGNYRAMLA
ncbi:MAG: IS3 family transposase, partial [Myxococcaceae bacterium]